MSQSKKANKSEASEKIKSAQKTRSSAHSVHVAADSAKPLVSQMNRIKASGKPRPSRLLTNVLRVLALFAVIAITLYVYSIRSRVEQFSALGYPGIFLIALLANATVLLPAPGVAVIYAMGAIFNPFGVGLAAGTGGALGELSGYLAGFSGQAVIERTNVYDRVQPWVKKYGGWAILVLSAVPNPFFDVAGIAAGIAKMPLPTFLVFTLVGQLIKMTLFALAGYYSVPLLTDFIK